MEFMPEHAPLVFLAFLGVAGVLGLSLLLIIFALVSRKKWLGIFAGGFACAVASIYLLALAGVSLTSHVKLLAPGERKYFCEIDCHIAYSVESVEQTASLGDELHQVSANGRFVIVHLKTWFDPSTISAHRGDGELAPGARHIALMDDSGREFAPAMYAQTALEKLRPATTAITQPLRPGESYITEVVFDLPANARNPRLFVGDGYRYPDKFVIGHEDSFWHKKIYMALTPGDTISAGRIP